jgi:NAD(P)-dependent dehydrogenase (short-subunit alcohol dehydrogenase family)
MDDFKGRVVVVTGAASGIGRETALAFARLGARLVICDKDTVNLESANRQLEALGGEVIAETVDVSDARQVEDFCERTYAAVGRVDVLCNNAGVAVGGHLEDMSLDDWEWIVGANLWGVIYGCHFFYPRMIAQGGGGHIVNTSSGAGLMPLPLTIAYNTTKFAVRGLSETLRAEAALHGIGVSAVCPGLVATNITRTMRFVSGTRRSTPEELVEKFHRFWHARRYPPSKVASAIVRGVEKNKAIIIAGPETYLGDISYRLNRAAWGLNMKSMVKTFDRWL